MNVHSACPESIRKTTQDELRKLSVILNIISKLTLYHQHMAPSTVEGKMSDRSQSREGSINKTFTIEIVSNIWHYMTLVDVLQYGATNHMLRDEVHNAIRDTVHEIIGKFCDNPTDFLARMLAENAVISGSAALYVLLAVHFSSGGRSQYGWKPNDLDVYIPRTPHIEEQVPHFVTYLVQHHSYDLRQQLGHLDLNYPSSEVFEIYHLFKGQRKIDVIVSKTHSSIRPIFRFHSSQVMNCISGRGVFSAYPRFTCDGKGLTNPMSTMTSPLRPNFPSQSVRIAHQKYRSRGFDIRLNPSCWQGDDHNCGKDLSCPHVVRTATDSGCLFVQIRPKGVDTEKEVRPHNTNVISDVGETPFDIVWYLGGEDCKGGRPKTAGFVDYIP